MSTSAHFDELALSYELLEAMMTPDDIPSSSKPPTNYELMAALREAMETPDYIPAPSVHDKRIAALQDAFELLKHCNVRTMAQLAKAMQE
jgi:hypothetical protein